MPSADPPLLSSYLHTTEDKVRYADTDRQGHVNNAQFAVFLETSRMEVLLPPGAPLAAAGCEFVLAHLELDLLAEIQWPGSVNVGLAVERIGNSSVTLVQGIFQNERPCALAKTVVVQISQETRRSSPLSEVARARFASLQAP